MKKVFIAAVGIAAICIVVLLLLEKLGIVAPVFHGGFTDSQVREVERIIKDYYVKQLSASPSATEREQVAGGSTTVEVHMIKVSDRKLEGFAKISLHDQQSKDLGLSEIADTCEATMEMNSSQYIWKCKPEH